VTVAQSAPRADTRSVCDIFTPDEKISTVLTRTERHLSAITELLVLSFSRRPSYYVLGS